MKMNLNCICNEILHTAEASDFKQIASLLSYEHLYSNHIYYSFTVLARLQRLLSTNLDR